VDFRNKDLVFQITNFCYNTATIARLIATSVLVCWILKCLFEKRDVLSLIIVIVMSKQNSRLTFSFRANEHSTVRRKIRKRVMTATVVNVHYSVIFYLQG